MNPVAIQLGPFSIRWYAICIILGLLLAVILSMKEAPRKGIESDDIIDFILIAFPVAIIGARMERWNCYLWWAPCRGSSPLPIFTQSFD